MTLAFHFEGFELTQAFYYGFFHSISAFCNAGFSLFDSNLEAYATNPFVHGTIAVLAILGGLGFIVLRELSSVIRLKKGIKRLGFHTKIVLITSSILIFFRSINDIFRRIFRSIRWIFPMGKNTDFIFPVL